MKQKQKEGYPVAMMKDEPVLTYMEELLFGAIGQCETYTDIYLFCEVNGIVDNDLFIQSFFKIKGVIQNA